MNKLRDHVYEFDEVIIGMTVPSLLYSYIFNLPILYMTMETPKFYEFINNSVNLTKTGLVKENKQIVSPKGKTIKPYSKQKVMSHLYFIQSMCGNIPFKGDISNIYLDEESKILKIVSKNQKIFKYKFNKLRIFDTKGLEFLTPIGEDHSKLCVLDEFKMNLKSENLYHIIQRGEDFPRNIYISSDKKRLMSHSLLTQEEIHLPELSSFFITKQTEKILQENNVKASLEWVKRVIVSRDLHKYEQIEGIIIDRRNEGEIWKERKIPALHTWLGSFRSRMVHRMMDTPGQTP